MNPVDAYIAPGAPPGPPPLTLGGAVNPVDAYLAGGAPPGPPPLTLGGAVNPVDAYLAGGAAKPPLTLGGAADPVDAFLAQPAPGAANPVDEYLGGAPIQAPTFGRKAAAAPGGGGGAKDMKNAMQEISSRRSDAGPVQSGSNSERWREAWPLGRCHQPTSELRFQFSSLWDP
ncbi:unnamed protein product [Effrenium voratum]|nr:unnamed protein product [Effrenium voratum]